MPIYSHSRLSTYEDCPLKYKLHYLDRIERDSDTVEGFLGSRVHDALQKCYDDVRLARLNSLQEIVDFYDSRWDREWNNDVAITKKGFTADHYRARGRRMVETYYRRHAPFDADITIATEIRVSFILDPVGKYRLTGFIDRLAQRRDGMVEIHDYKTSGHLPAQVDVDADRQLALYQIGVQQKWPDTRDIRLVWHYLDFDRDLISARSDETITQLVSDTTRLIDEIESAEDFLPKESGLCDWCEYPDLCPARKHSYLVTALPEKQFISEPGVVLVNRYADLKRKADEISDEMSMVREALIDHGLREGLTVIRGTAQQVRLRTAHRFKFPGKNDTGRKDLEAIIIEAGKWDEVSQLDTAALAHAVQEGAWDAGLTDQVKGFGQEEESTTVYLSRMKEREE